ncbi:glycosyltransferase [Candidatus Igneacidithiobacillus taiwanensis]|uniref:glycosyltransferase n=1 Tax=Candidatus Igneacidithiobacillus taiwanensis TaxID=1945924 RepID=UPI00289AA5FF|nr:glycosyltransferase [Candidatus Igneacidithiobacillus taiwanensis]
MTETGFNAEVLPMEVAVAPGTDTPRILFVNQASVLGGAELSLLDIARLLPFHNRVALFRGGVLFERLTQAGVAVDILDPTGDGLSRVRKNSGLWNVLGSLALLVRITWRLQLLAGNADITYANSQKAMVVGALASALARRPLIWHMRDILSADHFSPTMRRVAVMMANARAATVIANSHATAEAFVAAGGRRKLVRVIHNGIDSKPFDAITTQMATLARTELMPLDNGFLIGVFGRLTPWKGQHLVLEAISTLPGVSAVFIGDALFGEMEYKHTLHKRVECEDLRGRVRFLGFRDDVPRLMRAVDAIVHSSVNPEPFGRVIIEGMLARRPVVASAAGGVLEIIEDGETGLIYPPGDCAALRAQIERLQNDPALCERLGAAGYNKAQACFSRTAMIYSIRQVVMDTYLRKQHRTDPKINNKDAAEN